MAIEHPIDRTNNQLPTFGRVRWNCRRGMKELEVLLIPFADSCYEALSDEKKNEFMNMLEYDDASLYAWFLGYEKPPSQALEVIIREVQSAVSQILSDSIREKDL